MLRILFLLIFFCNIPFVFFAGKIALMALVYQVFYEKKQLSAAEQAAALEAAQNGDAEGGDGYTRAVDD